jgi:CheY-like chemotaxis protein
MGSAQAQSVGEGTPGAQAAKAEGALFLGSAEGAGRDGHEEASRRAGTRASFCWDAEEAQAMLADASFPVPRCIVVDGASAGLERLVYWLRGEARLFPVPVVVQAQAPSDASFLRAHALGADDVVLRGDVGGITRRLANLAEFDPAARPPLTQGAAVVAHADEPRRRVLGRILRQAGFSVSFAESGDDLVRCMRGMAAAPPSLLVVDSALPGGGSDAAGRVRSVAGGETTPVVLMGPENALAELHAQAEAMGSAAVASEAAPADTLLFLANELLRPDVKDARASTRVLYGAICGFRPAGSLEPVYGLTYNISREGLYVRTLDPPRPGSTVWFEVRPPQHEGVVHLRGKVVWCRGMRSPGGAAPAGFGLRIVDEACPPPDLAAYVGGYERLL